MWGAAPRPGRGGALCAPENGEQSVQARRAKPSTATENGAPRWGDKEIAEQRNQTSKPPNFQTSNCPCTRRHVCDVPCDTQGRTGDTGDSGDAGRRLTPPVNASPVAPQGRSVLRSLWPWKVCPSGCTLCSPGRHKPPLRFRGERITRGGGGGRGGTRCDRGEHRWVGRGGGGGRSGGQGRG